LCPQGLVLMLFVDQSWLYWLSHSVWSVWIETLDQLNGQLAAKSHSVWSVWIETGSKLSRPTHTNVALRMECVD
jgi:hypothetical protein